MIEEKNLAYNNIELKLTTLTKIKLTFRHFHPKFSYKILYILGFSLIIILLIPILILSYNIFQFSEMESLFYNLAFLSNKFETFVMLLQLQILSWSMKDQFSLQLRYFLNIAIYFIILGIILVLIGIICVYCSWM